MGSATVSLYPDMLHQLVWVLPHSWMFSSISLCFISASIKYCHWETTLAGNKATSVSGHPSMLTMKRSKMEVAERNLAGPSAVPSRVAGSVWVWSSGFSL